MIAEKLSAYLRLPYVNSISNPPLLSQRLLTPQGKKHENSLRKARRKVGKTMSTNPNQLSSNTPLKTKQKKQEKASLKYRPRHFQKILFSKTPIYNSFFTTANQRNKNSILKQIIQKNITYHLHLQSLKKLQKSHNTAVEPEEIHYEFLKHLTKNSLVYVLKNIQ